MTPNTLQTCTWALWEGSVIFIWGTVRPRTYPGTSKWLVGKMETKFEGDPQSWNLLNKPWPLNKFTEIKKYKESNWVGVRTAKILNYVLKNFPAGEDFISSIWNSSFKRDKDVPSPNTGLRWYKEGGRVKTPHIRDTSELCESHNHWHCPAQSTAPAI